MREPFASISPDRCRVDEPVIERWMTEEFPGWWVMRADLLKEGLLRVLAVREGRRPEVVRWCEHRCFDHGGQYSIAPVQTALYSTAVLPPELLLAFKELP